MMMEISMLNPMRCKMWEKHDRADDCINEYSCKDLIASISTHGQLVPVLARRTASSDSHDYELIYGARRFFAARYLNIPLTAEVRHISDREAIVALDIENRHRQDISPYERGKSYKRWLSGGYFASQEDLAKALHISPSQVSRLIKVANLPSVVIGAFETPADVCEKWALQLHKLWTESEHCREQLASIARQLSAKTAHRRPAYVYQSLVAAAVSRQKKQVLPTHDEVVAGKNGRPLFRIRMHRDSVAFLIPSLALSPSLKDQLIHQISKFLQNDEEASHSGTKNV